MFQCYRCGSELAAETDFGRRESCGKCGSATHVCRNCVHYDTSKYNECAEPVAERVVDKEKANFCDDFKPSKRAPGSPATDARQSAREAAEALFKKKLK